MNLPSVMLIKGGADAHQVTSRWLGLTELDRLSRNERIEIERELQIHRRCAFGLRFYRGLENHEHVANALANARENARWALYFRELLRRDEEYRLRNELTSDPEVRRWPERKELWMPVACDSCDFTREKALKLDADKDAVVRAMFGDSRGKPLSDEAARQYQRASTAQKTKMEEWSRCTGTVVFVRQHRALWEQTPGAIIELALEARDVAAGYAAP